MLIESPAAQQEMLVLLIIICSLLVKPIKGLGGRRPLAVLLGWALAPLALPTLPEDTDEDAEQKDRDEGDGDPDTVPQPGGALLSVRPAGLFGGAGRASRPLILLVQVYRRMCRTGVFLCGAAGSFTLGRLRKADKGQEF